MKEKERNKLVSFLQQRDVFATYKYWLMNYGTIKNFYVFCDNMPAELAIRSAFPWNAESVVKGCDAEKFWGNLNSWWIDCLADVVGNNIGPVRNKIDALKEVFRLYQIPNSPRKFGNKIGASEADVKAAIEELRIERKQKQLSQEAEVTTPEVKEDVDDIKPVEYDWAQLKTINQSGRSSVRNPAGREMRVTIKEGRMYMLLFSKEVSDELVQAGCNDSMDMAVDNLNRLVFVFGKGKKYAVAQYTKDGSLKVQNKAITQTLEKYLQTTFVNGKNYYVELGKQHYSEATKQVAIVVSNTVIDK
jgi:hypothetical protein